MRLGPRAKLLLLASLFMAPIVASSIAYWRAEPGASTSYGELLLPPSQVGSEPMDRVGGAVFTFTELAGRWVMVTADSGDCGSACLEKNTAVRQVRTALGRKAPRVARVFIVDDGKPPSEALAAFEGVVLLRARAGSPSIVPPELGRDRDHIYLVDPNGNVMMRWPAAPDLKRMLRDMDRLLRASQIG